MQVDSKEAPALWTNNDEGVGTAIMEPLHNLGLRHSNGTKQWSLNTVWNQISGLELDSVNWIDPMITRRETDTNSCGVDVSKPESFSTFNQSVETTILSPCAIATSIDVA